jgi:hypothetical protein
MTLAQVMADTTTAIQFGDGATRWFGGLPSNTRLGRRKNQLARRITCRVGWVTRSGSRLTFAHDGRTVRITDHGDAVTFTGDNIYAADMRAAVDWFIANGLPHVG